MPKKIVRPPPLTSNGVFRQDRCRAASALTSEALLWRTSGTSEGAVSCTSQRPQKYARSPNNAAMPSHPVFMVIGCVTCSHDELNICAPPAATAISITICDETRMWYAHAMVMFRQLQGGCDGEAWWTSFTLCGSQRTLSVTRGSIRTLTSLADCTASAAGSSAASGAASTSRCRAVEQRPFRSLRITTSVQAEPHLW